LRPPQAVLVQTPLGRGFCGAERGKKKERRKKQVASSKRGAGGKEEEEGERKRRVRTRDDVARLVSSLLLLLLPSRPVPFPVGSPALLRGGWSSFAAVRRRKSGKIFFFCKVLCIHGGVIAASAGSPPHFGRLAGEFFGEVESGGVESARFGVD
jgi:hypothetical protein